MIVVLLELPVAQDAQELMGKLDREEILVREDYLELKDSQVCLVNVVIRDSRESLVLKDYRDPLVNEEWRDNPDPWLVCSLTKLSTAVCASK